MGRRSRRVRSTIDQSTVAEAVSHAGIDPREWLTSGTVVDDVPVEYDEDLGPLVTVVCQPSKKVVRCRVAQSLTGDGEGEVYPWVAGDEVLVAIPEGMMRGNCIIIGRLNNTNSKHPKNIAGQDPSTNSFGYRSQRAPYVVEVAGPYLVRSSLTGSMFGLDKNGGVVLRDGQGAGLVMAADHFTYQGPGGSGPGTTPDLLFQLDLTNHRMTMQVGDALFTLSGSQASPQANAIAVPGDISVINSGNPAHEHVATTESVVNFIVRVFDALALVLNTPPLSVTPLTGASLGAILKDPVFATTVMQAAIPLAANLPMNPVLGAAITAAFGSATQKPPGIPGTGQLSPGLGCPGFKSG
jgi:hypothetical protein